MKTRAIADPKILNQIRGVLSQCKQERSGRRRHPPEALKRLAAGAVERGHTPGAVARAAGVSRQSVVNWCRKTPSGSRKPPAPPIELKVIQDRIPASVQTRTEPTDTVRIFFRGGAFLECPPSALSAELLRALNRAES